MSDGLLRRMLDSIVIDPDLGPNAVLIRSGDEQGIVAAIDPAVTRELQNDPSFTEDIASLCESKPFFTRFREATEPIRCECCGTLVVSVPEALAGDPPPRKWRPAIWEHRTGRKHTLRRCTATRAQAPGYG